MSCGHGNVQPLTADDAIRLEWRLRRAINNQTPVDLYLVGTSTRWTRLRARLRFYAPELLNLSGTACIALVVWPHPLPLTGVACFAVASVISMRRAAR